MVALLRGEAPRWPRAARRFSWLGLAATAGHVLVMGLSGWLTPANWPGGLPPITLLAFLVAVWPLLAWFRRRAG
jgi:hypothetical protein